MIIKLEVRHRAMVQFQVCLPVVIAKGRVTLRIYVQSVQPSCEALRIWRSRIIRKMARSAKYADMEITLNMIIVGLLIWPSMNPERTEILR